MEVICVISNFNKFIIFSLRKYVWSMLPIIVISARSEDMDKINALDAGADD